MIKEQRLIDANALKEKAEPEEVTGEGIVYVQDIDEAPTVDAVEVVHAEWQIYETVPSLEKAVRCSACKHTAYYMKDRWADIRLTNYCPDCGAKMDGGINK